MESTLKFLKPIDDLMEDYQKLAQDIIIIEKRLKLSHRNTFDVFVLKTALNRIKVMREKIIDNIFQKQLDFMEQLGSTC